MTRIAVLGANGQVGAEVSLLLAQRPGVQVVPISRTRMGSAYLRYRGLPCRHGSVVDPEQAYRLVGDCDVIANFVLINTTLNPSAARRANQALAENIIRCSRSNAKHIFFSTMSVYGDAEVGERLVFRNAYGQDKRRTEKLVLQAARRASRTCHIFRLGHVCGDLQGITRQIRDLIRGGQIDLPDPQRLSNTTHVATIVDTILRVADGSVPPATYDLMNLPQWSWREVFEYEGERLGVPIQLATAGGTAPARGSVLAMRAAQCLLAAIVNPKLRKVASRAVPLLPQASYQRLKALYSIRSAATEIAQLRRPMALFEAGRRLPLDVLAVPGVARTRELLQDPRNWLSPDAPARRWPDDLALAAPAGMS